MKHFRAIDGLRAWMAWWVVIQHLLQLSGFDRLFPNVFVRLLTLGGLAVIEFVIISGFVTAHLLVTKRESYGVFVARRLIRIYPLYLMALIFAFSVMLPYRTLVADAPWAAPERLAQWHEIFEQAGLHFFLHTLLVQGLVPDVVLNHASQSILAPAWSLSLEWQYYLVAPLVVSVFLAGRVGTIIALSMVCMTAMIVTYAWGSQSEWEYPAFLPLIIGLFLLGAATRFYFEGQRWRLIPMLAVTIVNFWLYARNYAGGNFATAAIPVMLWLLVLTISIAPRWLPRWCAALGRILLEHRVPVNLGLWSYATYLLHVPLFVVSLWLLQASGMPISQYSYFVVLTGSCLILIPLSFASYRLIEQPCIRIGNRLLSSLLKRISPTTLPPQAL